MVNYYQTMLRYAVLWCVVLCALFGVAQAGYPKVYTVTGKESGLSAWVSDDHYLPIVSLRIAFKHTGYAHDPDDKSGLAYLATNMMLEGTESKDAKTLKEQFETMATSVSFSVDRDHFYVAMTSLTTRFEESLALLSEVLTTLQFDEAALEKNKQYVNTLRQQNSQQPNYVASRAFSETVFANHPYSKPKLGTEKTVNSITVQDVMTYVQTKLARSNMAIAVAGDVGSAMLSLSLDKYFSALPEAADVTEVPSVSWPKDARTITIEKDIPQSVMVFGFPGVQREDQRFYATYVMNQILGGSGFESRLLDRIREKNGLVYSAYSYVDTYAKTGFIQGGMATSNAQVKDATALFKQEIRTLKEHGITVEELQHAKDYLLYAFPLKLTKNSNIAAILLSMQLNSLGQDFLQKRNDYVRQVNLADVNTMARSLLGLDKMVLVIVGKNK